MWNKLKLHAVAIDKASHLHIAFDMPHELPRDENKYLFVEEATEYGYPPHHLHLTDDSEIKEGNWYIHNNQLFQAGSLMGNSENRGKLVATSNKELLITSSNWGGTSQKYQSTDIAKIPISLIKYFADNQGKVDEIEVEYEERERNLEEYVFGAGSGKISKIKLNPQGEIEWRPIENKLTIDWEDVFNDAQSQHLQEFINYQKNKYSL